MNRTMKYLGILTVIFGLGLFSCIHNNQPTAVMEKQIDNSKDKEEIEKLLCKVLNWSDSKESIDLLPVMTNSKQTVYIGFDMDKLQVNLDKLRETGFFATSFIENYNQIIQTLDRKLRNHEYDWLVGDLPPFIFENDYNPWWNGQEHFSLQLVTIEPIKLNKDSGEFYFKCGDTGHGREGVENYKMKFKVVKEDYKWKISYLEGFDFKESTRKDGELEKTTTH
jgi:hypothetical protein